MRILRLVRQLETSSGGSSSSRSSNRISLTDPSIAPLLNGTWYLQYTSPSVVVEELNENENSKDDIDDAAGTWQPVDANEGDSNIETRPFRARGSISAAGVTVDTSNKSVQQIFDIEKRAVINVVALDWGTVQVAGTFRPSPTIANRAIVAFDTVAIAIGGGVVLQFGFVFDILATIRRSRDNGWLETTFVNENMRIGRGNKGTMFVLTRDSNAVKP